jgi:hypothetical protein
MEARIGSNLHRPIRNGSRIGVTEMFSTRGEEAHSRWRPTGAQLSDSGGGPKKRVYTSR